LYHGGWEIYFIELVPQKSQSAERPLCQRGRAHFGYMLSIFGAYEKATGLGAPVVLGVRPLCACTQADRSSTAAWRVLWFPLAQRLSTTVLPYKTITVIWRADYLSWVLVRVPEAT